MIVGKVSQDEKELAANVEELIKVVKSNKIKNGSLRYHGPLCQSRNQIKIYKSYS
jgi:predicted metallopeptidase